MLEYFQRALYRSIFGCKHITDICIHPIFEKNDYSERVQTWTRGIMPKSPPWIRRSDFSAFENSVHPVAFRGRSGGKGNMIQSNFLADQNNLDGHGALFRVA
jgi:hypothetical protein